jgi:hypothetical protein
VRASCPLAVRLHGSFFRGESLEQKSTRLCETEPARNQTFSTDLSWPTVAPRSSGCKRSSNGGDLAGERLLAREAAKQYAKDG